MATDSSILVRRDDENQAQGFLVLYVGNIFIMAPGSVMSDTLERFSAEVKIKISPKLASGAPRKFLGMDYRLEDGMMIVDSSGYIGRALKSHGMGESKFLSTPGAVERDVKKLGDTPLGEIMYAKFRAAIGQIGWLAVTRYDIKFAAKEVQRAPASPSYTD